MKTGFRMDLEDCRSTSKRIMKGYFEMEKLMGLESLCIKLGRFIKESFMMI